MMLLWDGLQVRIPHKMEPATLDRGFIRLFGPELPAVDLRFGPERRQFDPHRDGRRILRAAGLSQEPFEPCRESWSRHLQGNLHSSSRLYLFQFRESRGVVATLFSVPPPPGLAEAIFTSLAWTPPNTWRRWCCYDITFETPPGYVLSKAVFRPGWFYLTFTKGSSVLTFDRLAPANALLDNMTLISWYRQHFHRDLGCGATILPRSDTEADLVKKPSLLYRAFPWLPGLCLPLRGKIRHVHEGNKILILTEQGTHVADAVSHRLHTSYANTLSSKK